jgi:hypothetical protein
MLHKTESGLRQRENLYINNSMPLQKNQSLQHQILSNEEKILSQEKLILEREQEILMKENLILAKEEQIHRITIVLVILELVVITQNFWIIFRGH